MIQTFPFAMLAVAFLLAGSQGSTPVKTAQLDVRVDGPGRVMMPGGRICHSNSSCIIPVPLRSRVPLRVMQEKGDGHFRGWDGVCMAVKGPECIVVMRADRVAIARFSKRK